MNVFIIQPPDPSTPLSPLDTTQGAHRSFSPPWNLMCLQGYLHKHTRHICRFVDCRLMSDLDTELPARLAAVDTPRILVINCPTLALGQVAAVLDTSKRHFPNMRTILCGDYPSAFPDQVREIPRVDFALAGDPEPILRRLLDSLDVEARLRRIPGLILADSHEVEPYWLPNLDRLAPADWRDIFWSEYSTGTTLRQVIAEARLSRGHTGAPADRAFSGASEPLRFWPMDTLASLISRSTQVDINEVMLTDPPGVWTPERLSRWVEHLTALLSAHPWSVRLLPMTLDKSTVDDMQSTRCRRVELIFPTCDLALFPRYGLSANWRVAEDMVTALREKGIRVIPRFWIGNIEESRGEADRIAQAICRFAFHDYIVEPYPFALDSPLYREQMEEATLPGLTDWIRWSRAPWTAERPVALWGGPGTVDTLREQLNTVRKGVGRNPAMLLRRIWRGLHIGNWIQAMENRALAFLQR